MTDEYYIADLKNDPISRLYAQYFLQADVLFRYHQILSQERKRKGRLSGNKELDELHLFKLWLASLWVVVDGFQTAPIQKPLQPWKDIPLDIRVHCSSIAYKVTQLGEELRLFRNATFHFQANPEKHAKFLQVKSRHQPIILAEELHREFAMLFREYRVLKFEEYLMQGANRESFSER
jgi:hypothetical protein